MRQHKLLTVALLIALLSLLGSIALADGEATFTVSSTATQANVPITATINAPGMTAARINWGDDDVWDFTEWGEWEEDWSQTGHIEIDRSWDWEARTYTVTAQVKYGGDEWVTIGTADVTVTADGNLPAPTITLDKESYEFGEFIEVAITNYDTIMAQYPDATFFGVIAFDNDEGQIITDFESNGATVLIPTTIVEAGRTYDVWVDVHAPRYVGMWSDHITTQITGSSDDAIVSFSTPTVHAGMEFVLSAYVPGADGIRICYNGNPDDEWAWFDGDNGFQTFAFNNEYGTPYLSAFVLDGDEWVEAARGYIDVVAYGVCESPNVTINGHSFAVDDPVTFTVDTVEHGINYWYHIERDGEYVESDGLTPGEETTIPAEWISEPGMYTLNVFATGDGYTQGHTQVWFEVGSSTTDSRLTLTVDPVTGDANSTEFHVTAKRSGASAIRIWWDGGWGYFYVPDGEDTVEVDWTYNQQGVQPIYAQAYFGNIEEHDDDYNWDEFDWESLDWSANYSAKTWITVNSKGNTDLGTITIPDTVTVGRYFTVNIGDDGNAEYYDIYVLNAQGEELFSDHGIGTGSHNEPALYMNAGESYSVIVNGCADGYQWNGITKWITATEGEAALTVSKTDLLIGEDYDIMIYAPGAELVELIWNDYCDYSGDWGDIWNEPYFWWVRTAENEETITIQAVAKYPDQDWVKIGDEVTLTVRSLGSLAVPDLDIPATSVINEPISFNLPALEGLNSYRISLSIPSRGEDIVAWDDIQPGTYTIDYADEDNGIHYFDEPNYVYEIGVQANPELGYYGDQRSFYVLVTDGASDANATITIEPNTTITKRDVDYYIDAEGAVAIRVYCRYDTRFYSGSHVEDSIHYDDPGTFTIYAQMSYDERYADTDWENFDWDNFDWENDIEWSNKVVSATFTVTSEGETPVGEITVPGSVVKGQLLAVTVEDNGIAETQYDLHLRAEGEEEELYFSRNHQPGTFYIPTTDLEAGNSYYITINALAEGYEWTEYGDFWFYVEDGGNTALFTADKTELSSNENTTVYLYYPGADRVMVMLDNPTADENSCERIWDGENNWYDNDGEKRGWDIGFDSGEYTLYGFAGVNGEWVSVGSIKFTVTSKGAIEVPDFAVPSTITSGTDLTFTIPYTEHARGYRVRTSNRFGGTFDHYYRLLDSDVTVTIPADSFADGETHWLDIGVEGTDTGYESGDWVNKYVFVNTAADSNITFSVSDTTLLVNESTVIKAYVDGATAIAIFRGDGNWIQSSGDTIEWQSSYYDEGTYYAYAKYTRSADYAELSNEDFDWGSFDWNEVEWEGTSELIAITVTKLGNLSDGDIVVPETVRFGETLNVQLPEIEHATEYHIYIRDEGSNEQIHVSLDHYEPVVYLPTTALNVGQRYFVHADWSAEGYRGNGIDWRKYWFTVEEGSNETLFDVSNATPVTNEIVLFTANVPGAERIRFVTDGWTMGDEIEGKSGHNWWDWGNSGTAEVELQAQMNGEWQTIGTKTITITAEYEFDISKLSYPTSINLGEDFTVSYDFGDIDGWLNFHIQRDDNGEWVYNPQYGNASTYTAPARCFEGGTIYNAVIDINARNYEKVHLDRRFLVVGETAADITLKVNDSMTSAAALVNGDLHIQITAPNAKAIRVYNGGGWWRFRGTDDVDYIDGCGEIGTFGFFAQAYYGEDRDWDDVDDEAFDNLEWSSATSNIVDVTLTGYGKVAEPEFTIAPWPIQVGKSVTVTITNVDPAAESYWANVFYRTEDGDEHWQPNWYGWDDVDTISFMIEDLDPNYPCYIDVNAHTAVGYEPSGARRELEATSADEANYKFEVSRTDITIGRIFFIYAEYPGADDILIKVDGDEIEGWGFWDSDSTYVDRDPCVYWWPVSTGEHTLTAYYHKDDVEHQFGDAITVYVTGEQEINNIMTLPSALTTIEDEAFVGIDTDKVVIPSTVTSIGSRAFANCANLKAVEFEGDVSSIASDAFEGSNNVVIYCPAGSHVLSWAKANGITAKVK